MKAFTLSKKSWHWRLAVTYGNHYEYDTDTDLCTYIRHVMRGIFVALLVTAAGGLCISAPMGSLLAWIAYVITHGMTEMDPVAFAGAALIGGITILTGLFVLFNTDAGEEVISKVKGAVKITIPKPKEDSFLVLAYRSFKDKTCVRLRVQ